MLWMLAHLALAGSPKASSELTDAEGVKHPATAAFDGLLATGWAEGVPGSGAGSTIELKFDRATEVSSITLWPGDLSNGQRSLREHGRPKLVTVELATAAGPVTQQVRLLDPATEGNPRRVQVDVTGTATALKITIDEAYEGGVYDDTFITEVGVNFSGGWQPAEVEKARKWQGTPEAEKAEAKDRDQVIAWYDAIKGNEFGDPDTFAKIEAQAADGAPFMRKRAASVPYGFRMQAIPPDDTAIDALLKLKDPNGIAALTMASLRVSGAESKALAAKVDYFEAYAEMLGGPHRNVPNWGQHGWAVGELSGLGEPLAIVIDGLGEVFVADTGNNRVQRFNPQGKADKTWSGDPEITNVWFEGTRKYYVSGATSGKGGGHFISPIDIAVAKGKKGADAVVVLDGTGRVQVIGPEGAIESDFKLGVDDSIESGVGGQGFVEVLGSSIVVIWGRLGFTYAMDGTEKARFELSDGYANGAVALKGGKIGVVFDKQVVAYSPDGFRQGQVLDVTDLGQGFESFDVTSDDKGKLWVLTDDGTAWKLKKPGVVDWSVPIAAFALEMPRFAVQYDVVYVTDRDKILRVDALEIHAKAEAAAEGGS